MEGIGSSAAEAIRVDEAAVICDCGTEQVVRALEESEERYRTIVDKAPVAIVLFQDNRIVFGNQRAADIFLCESTDELLGHDLREHVDADQLEMIGERHKNAVEGHANPPLELKASRKDGSCVWMETTSTVINLDGNQTLVAMLLDITARKEAEFLIQRHEEALSEQRLELDKKSYALEEILKKLGTEEERVKSQISANITSVIHPLIARLRTEVPEGPRRLVDIVESALTNIADRFGLCMRQSFSALSRKEKEMCNLIRNGLTTKEIAYLMGVCPSTVESHRKNIRKKLGLQNSGVNLSTFLYDVGDE